MNKFTSFCLSINQPMDIWIDSTFCPLWIMLPWIFFSYGRGFSVLLGMCLHSLACGCPVVPEPCVEKTILFPHWIISAPLPKSIHHEYMDLFPDFQFYPIDLYVSPYVSVYCLYYCSFVVSYEIYRSESPILLLFSKIVVAF